MTNYEKLADPSPLEPPFWKPEDYLKPNEIVKLHISIPTYSGKIDMVLESNLRMAVEHSLLKDRLAINLNYVAGDSLVPRARDKMALAFLESNDEWQLQIDDDIIFPYGLGPMLAKFYKNWMSQEVYDVYFNQGVFRKALTMNAIDEVLRSAYMDNQKIVGGLYFWRGGSKNLNEASSVLPLDEQGNFNIEFKMRPDNYIYTNKLATGFLLVHRSVYEAIEKKFPELIYNTPTNHPTRPTTAFYLPNITKEPLGTNLGGGNDKEVTFYRSEDYAFAWRAEQCGFKPCLNMNLLLGHVGTNVYSWFDRPILQKLLLGDMNQQHHFGELKK